jgi:hypothetical protein
VEEAPVVDLRPPAEEHAIATPEADLRRVAPSPEPARAPAPPQKGRWYGWQTLAADGAALAMLIAASNSDNGVNLTRAAFTTYLLAPAVLHSVHGNFGRGAGSIAIRAGAPLLLAFGGGMLGLLIEPQRGDSISPTFAMGLALGLLTGYLGAVSFDIAVATERPAEEPPQASAQARLRRRTPALELGPTFALERGGASMGMLGRF